MATTTNITSTYAGEAAARFIGAALLANNTLGQDLITFEPNVKYKKVIRRMGLSDIVKDATCAFDPQGTMAITERVLEPKFLQVNLQLCKQDFVDSWDALQLGFTAHNENLPSSVQEFVISRTLGQMAEATEQDIWAGPSTGDGRFEGIVTKLETGSASVASYVEGATLTTANVIDELGKVVDEIPAELYGREDLYLYISQTAARHYVRALGGFAANGLGGNGVNNQGTLWFNNGDLSFDGVKLAVVNGMPAQNMVATTKDNLYFGTGLLGDHNEVKLIDQSEITGSQFVNFIARYSAGTQIGFLEDVVLRVEQA